MPERLIPATREVWLTVRRGFIGGSEIGALFGVSPYLTPYGLWAEKTGRLDPPVFDNRYMKRGRLIEAIAPLVLADERPGWVATSNVIGQGGAHYVDREQRLAATPDLFVEDEAHRGGIVQVKSAGSFTFRRDWHDETGAPACPRWIALQAVQEAALTGAAWAAVLVIAGENFEPHLFDIPLDGPDNFAAIEATAAAFWAGVDSNTPPPLDYERDGDLLKRLYPADKEPLLVLNDPAFLEAVEDYRDTGADIALLTVRRERARNAILEALGNHKGALCGTLRVSAPVTNRKEFTKTYPATSYRTIRIKQLD
jgi:hypothetical protein